MTPRLHPRVAHVPNATLPPRAVMAALARPAQLEASERRASELLGGDSVVLFASARAALAAAIEALCPPGGTVGLPAFTCVAVPNAALSAHATPRYADVDARGLVPLEEWARVDADLVVVQDTYGFRAADPPRVAIRDAAHAVDLDRGAARVAVGSFEQSKALGAGGGGLAVTPDEQLAEQIREQRDRHSSGRGSFRAAVETLLITAVGRLEYAGLPTLPLRLALRRTSLGTLRGQSPEELAGGGVDRGQLGRPSGVVIALMLRQLAERKRIAAGRANLVALYDRRAGISRPPGPLVRYPMRVSDRAVWEQAMRRDGWDLRGAWFRTCLHPASSGEAFGLAPGSAPHAEELARVAVNLPTHPLVRDDQAERLIDLALAHGARPLT